MTHENWIHKRSLKNIITHKKTSCFIQYKEVLSQLRRHLCSKNAKTLKPSKHIQ